MLRRIHLVSLGTIAGLSIVIALINACLLKQDSYYCTDNSDCESQLGPGAVCREAAAGAEPGKTCVMMDAMSQPDAQCADGCCGSTPISDNGECRSCTPGVEECSSSYPTMPICESSGACAGCVSDEQCVSEALCTEGAAGCVCRADGSCGACTSHADCDSGICSNSECVRPSAVTYVAVNGADMNCGARETPCRMMSNALMRQTEWIYVTRGDYTESVSITTGIVRIVGEPDDAGDIDVRFNPTMANPTVWSVSGAGTDVSIEGLAIEGATNGAPNVLCQNSAKLRVYRSRVAAGAMGALGISAATNCNLTVSRTKISENSGGGINITSSMPVALTNNIIVNNGSSTSAFGGIRVDISPSQTVVSFSSIAGNKSVTGRAAGIECLSAIIGQYNVLYNPDATLEQGALCGDMTQSLIGEDVSLDPQTYHLTAASTAAIDQVVDPGNVTEDFDGQVRPNGTAADIGADEYYPR